VTLPLNLKQIKAMKAQQELQPKIAELQKKYGKDRERLTQAQMELYKEAGVNPLGGCLPLLIQLPILWALFGALQNVRLKSIEPSSFFIIPDLHCPSCSQWPSGVGWLWPFKDGQPPVGWETALPYLILPVLLIATQLIMQKLTPTATAGGGNQAQTMGTISIVFSLLFGYYSLIFPASLSLYYIVFNIFGIVQQGIVTDWAGLRPKAAAVTTGVTTSRPVTPLPTEATEPPAPTSKVVQSTSKIGGASKRAARRKRK
jgi:YidC/Oxa1 family membrane protein insertase